VEKQESPPHRPRGVLKDGGKDNEVWIEWREASKGLDGSDEAWETMIRMATLAQTLAAPKPRQFLTPTCIGYVDDRAAHSRLAWIFAMPEGSSRSTALRTLHSLLGRIQHQPSLSQRIALAHRLASSVLYLHTVGWLHKAVHSANVIFSMNDENLSIESPYLSGFEYSRPDSGETTKSGFDPRWDIYRWPTIQADVPRVSRSRKTYDIYSLGLLLLEIAHWQPLHILMSLKRWPEPSAQDARIRAWLLEEEGSPPFKSSNPLTGLRRSVGDKYYFATRRCLVAHGGSGMRVDEEGDEVQSSEMDTRLHTAFSHLVVEELKSIVT
ncbi:hypothetical protein LTR91_026625, partial [Friedmanniomyces endolithicus]